MIIINVISELENCIQILNRLDEYTSSLTEELSNYDKRTADLLHYIENNTLKAPQSCRIVKELKKIRQERRKIKNDMELTKVYRDNINKLINTDNRTMLMNKMYKTGKQLESEYQNRVYTQEELDDILKGSKK